MSTPKEGGTPANIVPISLRRAPEQGRFHGVKTPKQLLGKRWGATVFENPIRVPRPLPQNPGEQRGEAEPFQPNPAEQQAAERLGKPPPGERGGETLNQEVELLRRYLSLHVDELTNAFQKGKELQGSPTKNPQELQSTDRLLTFLTFKTWGLMEALDILEHKERPELYEELSKRLDFIPPNLRDRL